MNLADVALEALYVLGVLMCCALLSREEGSREGLGSRRARLFMLALAVEAMQAGLGSLAFREPWGAPFAPWQAFDLAGAVLADLFLARALLRGGGNPGPCFASMFVRQVRQCFSAVWADGFPRCRHRFPVM